MVENIDIRYGDIAIDETSTETHGRKVVIKLDATLMNVSLFDNGSKGEMSFINEVNTTVDTPAENVNALIDKNDATRYIFVCNVTSPITNNKSVIYYDNKYKDLFIIPSLASVGYDKLVKLYENDSVEITGYRLFGIGELKTHITNTTLSIERFEDETFKILDKPNRLTTTKSFLVHLNKMNSNAGVYMISNVTDTGVTLYDKVRQPTVFIDLGEIVDVFGKDIEIPTFNLLDSGINTNKLEYLGYKKSMRVMIPIPI